MPISGSTRAGVRDLRDLREMSYRRSQLDGSGSTPESELHAGIGGVTGAQILRMVVISHTTGVGGRQ